MGGSIRQVRSSGGPGRPHAYPLLALGRLAVRPRSRCRRDPLGHLRRSHGRRDLWSALRRMYQRGAQTPQGRMPGLQDLLKRLRKERQQKLDRYDLGSTMEDIQKKLDEILQMERQGIE